jgi:hypothetical protein
MKLTLHEQLELRLRKARKLRDIEAVAYYQEMLGNPNLTACAAFDRKYSTTDAPVFKGTQAYFTWSQQLIHV